MARRLGRGIFDWRQARVAGLAVIATLILAYAVYRVGVVFDVFARRYELTTLVPSALGLRPGAPVTLAGQRIGQVKSIDFIPVEHKVGENNLRIAIAVSERVQDQIRTDSRAFLRTQGLLGDKFVDIAPGTSGARILLPGDTLVSGESLDIDQFLAMAAGTLDRVSGIVANLQDLTGGLNRGEGTMGQLLRDEQLYVNMTTATFEMQTILKQINGADGTFSRFIRDPALYERVHAAVARVDSLGSLILYGDGSVTRLLRSDSLYRSMIGTLRTADDAVVNLADFIQRMTTGDGVVQRLLTDSELYDEFLRTIMEVQGLIRDIRTDPGRFRPTITVDVF